MFCCGALLLLDSPTSCIVVCFCSICYLMTVLTKHFFRYIVFPAPNVHSASCTFVLMQYREHLLQADNDTLARHTAQKHCFCSCITPLSNVLTAQRYLVEGCVTLAEASLLCRCVQTPGHCLSVFKRMLFVCLYAGMFTCTSVVVSCLCSPTGCYPACLIFSLFVCLSQFA